MEMNKISLDVTEADIVRSVKNLKYSPIEHAISRFLKENVENVEAQKHQVLIWNNDDSDYECYRYLDSDIQNIRLFIEEWEDYKDGIIDDFCLESLKFEIEKIASKKN
jgi:hypothetical protein